MAFFISGLQYEHCMVAGWREGYSKQNKPYVTLTVVDPDGNTNTLSTSEPQTMADVKTLVQGQIVDLTITVAGGPKKQYAMISKVPNAVRPAGAATSATGY